MNYHNIIDLLYLFILFLFLFFAFSSPIGTLFILGCIIVVVPLSIVTAVFLAFFLGIRSLIRGKKHKQTIAQIREPLFHFDACVCEHCSGEIK